MTDKLKIDIKTHPYNHNWTLKEVNEMQVGYFYAIMSSSGAKFFVSYDNFGDYAQESDNIILLLHGFNTHINGRAKSKKAIKERLLGEAKSLKQLYSSSVEEHRQD